MTVQEMNREFDIYYNNIAGQSNPDLDIYEKSVYLTKAQLEIIKDFYDSLSNKKQKGFEGTEKRRRDLNQLVKPYKTASSFTNNSNIHINSRYFNIPSNTFLIVNEQVKITSSDCANGKTIEVLPITYDEFNKQIKNPFKLPDDSLAWRLDLSNINNQKIVEIISPYNISGSLEYQIRYIKYPRPIILGNLITLYPSEELSIDGLSIESPCELNESIHKEIIDRAVELALGDYKPQNVQTKVQLDSRNE